MERQAFDRLMVDQLPGLLRFAIQLTGDPVSGEDVAQDALVKAIEGADSLRDGAAIRSWLFTIVVNAHRDRQRRNRRNDLLDDAEPVSPEPGPTAGQAERETAQQVADAVSALPQRQREVIVLISYHHHSIAQAAEVLGISEQNVRTTLHLAREKLRAKLSRFLQA